ncbi:hypothetical protein [Thermaurantiacus sp.]
MLDLPVYAGVAALALLLALGILWWIRDVSRARIIRDSPAAPPPEASKGPEPLPLPAFPEARGPPDDLKQIKGIGPKLETLLNGLGITRFDQIAALSADELAALDSHLGAFQGRPMRDRWQDQARLLAAGDRKAFERLHGKLEPGA